MSRIANFEKNRFFEEILQRALFKTLVITIVFNPILDGGGGEGKFKYSSETIRCRKLKLCHF